MKALVKSAVNLLVLVSILFSSFAVPFYAPTVQAQQTQSEFEAQVTAELTAFAETHTQAELEAEINRRLGEAEETALNDDSFSSAPQTLENTLLFDDPMQSLITRSTPQTLKDTPRDFSALYGDRIDCLGIRQEACREDYNGELFLASGVGLTVLAGCTGITLGAGFIACGVAALGVQQAGFQAARSRRRGCNLRAQADCAGPSQ